MRFFSLVPLLATGTPSMDNKPAGGGIIANGIVAKAPPDGYKLGMISTTFTTGAVIRTNLTYDAVKSFKAGASGGGRCRGGLLTRLFRGDCRRCRVTYRRTRSWGHLRSLRAATRA